MINPLNNRAVASPPAAEADRQRAELRNAAQAFEAVFLRQMIGTMRQAHLSEDTMFGSQATDQFREMSDARLADQMSHQGAFGIAQMLLAQFDRTQPHQPTTPTGESE